MLQLLKASEILKVGLTISQVFYLVGREGAKKLCRFVKTDALRCAVTTLLAINGKRRQVQDIRLGKDTGLKVWTDKGIEFLPDTEVHAFLTRYNRLIREGCAGPCHCAQDSTEKWKRFCVHRIAEHLESVKEKLEVAAQTAKAVAADTSLKDRINELIHEAKYQIQRQNLTCSVDFDWGDTLIEVSQYDKFVLGHLLVTDKAQIKIVSPYKGGKEEDCATIVGALASLRMYSEYKKAG